MQIHSTEEWETVTRLVKVIVLELVGKNVKQDAEAVMPNVPSVAVVHAKEAAQQLAVGAAADVTAHVAARAHIRVWVHVSNLVWVPVLPAAITIFIGIENETESFFQARNKKSASNIRFGGTLEHTFSVVCREQTCNGMQAWGKLYGMLLRWMCNRLQRGLCWFV